MVLSVTDELNRAVAAYVSKDERRHDLAGQPPEIVIVPASVHLSPGEVALMLQ